MPRTRPITTQRFRRIDTQKYRSANHLVTAAVEDTSAVRAFNAIIAALILVFRDNLISEDPKEKVSLDFLLRFSLKGYSPGSPAVVSNITLLDKPSNSAETAPFIMEQAVSIAKKQS